MAHELLSWESAGNRHVGLVRRPFQARHRLIGELVAAGLPRHGSVIDVGCGLGQTLELLQANRPDASLTYVDPYQECLDQTSRFVRGTAVLIDEARLDVNQLGSGFDAVIASHVIEHSTDPVRLAKDLVRLSRPGGLVVLAVPNVARPKVLWYGARRRHYANRGHVVAWDPSHWRLFIEEAVGQRNVTYHADEVQVLPAWLTNRVAILRLVERRLAKLLPWWSFSNIVVIRRPVGEPD